MTALDKAGLVGLDRSVHFEPGYDRRREGLGIGTMRIRFVLQGKLGAVQWLIGTDWAPVSANYPASLLKARPTGWDLGYHSPVPTYEGQIDSGDCDLLPGKKCFYNGSGLNADLLIEGFIVGGEGYVWRALEAYYGHTFKGEPWPDFEALRALAGQP